MILLFPNKILSSTEGIVDNMVIHASNLEFPENSQGENFGTEVFYIGHEQNLVVHCATTDKNSYSWFTGFSLSNGKVTFESREDKINRLGVLTYSRRCPDGTTRDSSVWETLTAV